MEASKRKIFIVIFFSSLSSLAYEITLTRIFSISLWYHFAFMVVSIAMLGFGAGGTLLSLYPRLRDPSRIPLNVVLLGLSVSLSYLIANLIPFDPVRLSWERVQFLYIFFYYLTLSLPFFFAGTIVVTAFSSMSDKAGLLYASDLLGAGFGSLGILFCLNAVAPERVPFILSTIVLSSSFFVATGRLKRAIPLFILSCLALLFLRPVFGDLRMSPYKGLEAALRFPGAEHLKTYFSPFSRIDTFRSPAVRFAPGLSLRYLDTLPEQTGIAIDGGDINAITYSGDRHSHEFLRFLPSALPYEIGEKKDVLILDPKGGLQDLAAKHYGSHDIATIESNPLLMRIIRQEYAYYSGGLYTQNAWSGSGRSWLRRGERKFDIIDISLMGASPSGSFGISEDYRFTVEAFREYLDHLKPGGLISINLFLLPPPRSELRLLNTFVEVVKESGNAEAAARVVAIRSWDSICLLMKRSPFTPGQIEKVKRFSHDRRFDLVHYPGIQEDESNRYIRLPSNEYFKAFRDILDSHNRTEFIKNYLFDIRPVYDDRPFFQYYLRIENIAHLYRLMGQKWQYFLEEGYLLPAISLQVLFLSLVLVSLPLFKNRAEGESLRSGRIFLPYFAFLGLGYMSVETALIQKMILPLEHPPYAVATVLASMLMSSGIGSLLSHKVPWLRRPPVILAILALIMLYTKVLPPISSSVTVFAIPLRIVLFFVLLAPLGFLMGIPFPAGIRILGERDSNSIPWAWAMNGCCSVFAPILAVMIATALGFGAVLWLGALSYGLAFLTLTVSFRPHQP
ncbi:MAG TPA: hypothetical protein VFG09_14305 [Thermodesulfovibrionales bacterium]|nr:hypothetical protein [Thermodesulfovibrionales bacterium]